MNRFWMLAVLLGGCEGATGLLPDVYPTCGGLFATTCDDGLVCADTPGDDCNSATGGFDCGGICVACDDPGVDRTVAFDDPKDCKAMDFDCEQGEVQWSDDCGCGCQQP